MKKLLIILILFSTNLNASNFKLEKIIKGLDSPWSLSFVDEQNLFITEKSGNIKFVNLNEKIIKDVSHNLNVLEDGQGGLLDILYKNKVIFVSYSENLKKGYSVLMNNTKIVKTTKKIAPNDQLSVKLVDGTIDIKVKKIN